MSASTEECVVLFWLVGADPLLVEDPLWYTGAGPLGLGPFVPYPELELYPTVENISDVSISRLAIGAALIR